MFSTKQVRYLLELSNKVEKNGQLINELDFDRAFPFTHRYNLISPEDDEFIFLYDITQSSKNHFKLTLYLLDDETRIGLLRVDYNGQHKNPETVSDKLPDVFYPFAGKFFDYHEHHIHYYVEGYKTTLDWALPLVNDSFPVKKISKPDDIIEAFLKFNHIINLKTKFIINGFLL